MFIIVAICHSVEIYQCQKIECTSEINISNILDGLNHTVFEIDDPYDLIEVFPEACSAVPVLASTCYKSMLQ